MTRLRLPAGAAALALVAVISAACAGAAPPPTPSPAPSQAAEPSPAGPAQVEAGASLGEPTVEPVKPEAEVVYVGRRDFAAVALTFDTGVGPGHVAEVLDTLKEHGVRATFGITGEWAVTNPALLKRLVQEGHAVINHSWSHRSFTGEDTQTQPLTPEEMREELRRTEEKVQEVAGVSTKPYFRPPFGDFDRSVNQVVREAGYDYNVLWLVDGMGWDGRSTKSVVAVTLANAYNGAIFLYHADNPREPAALEEIIAGLNEGGLQLVTIPQLLGKAPMPTPGPTPTPAPTDIPPPPPLVLPPVFEPPPLVLPPVFEPPAPLLPLPTPSPYPTPTPAPAYTRVAFDDFESGGPEGGSGWLGPWQSTGPFVTSGDAPYAGSWQMDISSGLFSSRSADLAAQQNVHLRFWSRLSRVDLSHRAIVFISGDSGLTWQVVKELTWAESDGVYRLYDIDLSGFVMSANFAVGFYRLMSPLTDRWHIDDVELATPAP